MAKPGPKVFTARETAEQETLAAELLSQHVPRHLIVKRMRERFRIGISRTNRLCQRVLAAWAEEGAAERSTIKAKAIRAVESDMEDVRKSLADNPRAKHRALLGYHHLLADLQGTREPDRVQIDVRMVEALGPSIASLTTDQLEEYVASYQETVRLAEQAKLLLPAPSHAAE